MKFPLTLSACLASCIMVFTACGDSGQNKTDDDANIDDKDYYGEEVTFDLSTPQDDEVIKVDSTTLRAIIGPDRALENLHGSVRQVITHDGEKADTLNFDADGYYTAKKFLYVDVDFSGTQKTGISSVSDKDYGDMAYINIFRDDNGYLYKLRREFHEESDAIYNLEIKWADGKVKQKNESGWEFSTQVVYAYDDNGNLISDVEEGGSDGGSWKRDSRYTIISTDDYGNWTERKVDVTYTQDDFVDQYTSTFTYTEKRQISYY